MKLQPIIQAKLNNYKTQHEISHLSDGDAFERYANQTILTTHQPSAFSIESELLDVITVGGHDDMGIDGISVKLNGVLISSIDEAKDVIEQQKTADIEYIFLQSKYKEKFDSGEFGKFVTGIKDFLDIAHYQPYNRKIGNWLMIKEYLESEDVLQYWPEPTVRLYYVAMGKWSPEGHPHIIALENRFRAEIEKFREFKTVHSNYIDLDSFKRICDENENAFTAILDIIDSSSLPEVVNVNNSCLSVCSAESLLKMLLSSEGLLRRNLFSDNVRDYQGDTTINTEIFETIKNDPESFILLNNGITVVCDEVNFPNRKITIKNPQIVNGCQTCSVLYNAYKKGLSLSNMALSVKVISTKDIDIINRIVKGTNRQNIVFDEAFEITKPFHKDLEAFFSALPLDSNNDKIYYERRSKQFSDTPSILSWQKVNFKILIQSFVSIFLKEPHKGHRHESKLLQDYQNMIFIENQSKYPYYTAALIFQKVELAYRKDLIPNNLRAYKAQISFLLKETLAPNCPSINDEKKIGEYCEDLLKILWDKTAFDAGISETVRLFNTITSKWIEQRGEKYISGIKDSADFTKFLIDNINSGSSEQIITNKKLRGTIVSVLNARNGKQYGFISKYPRDALFHENDSVINDYTKLIGCEVLYDFIKDSNGRERAMNIELIT
ncbi:MAG: AIPR family protein [Oscillospiraceae bacterium]